jgi:hypothetical protein
MRSRKRSHETSLATGTLISMATVVLFACASYPDNLAAMYVAIVAGFMAYVLQRIEVKLNKLLDHHRIFVRTQTSPGSEGALYMTKEQATQTCAKALLRSLGKREENWGITPWAKDFATNLAICLEALDLLPKTTTT